MRGILIITNDVDGLTAIQSALVRESFKVAVCPPEEDVVIESAAEMTPEILIVDCRTDLQSAVWAKRLIVSECSLNEIQVIALSSPQMIVQMEWKGVDEFILEPFNADELIARIRFLFWKTKRVGSNQVIDIDNLVIDLKNYDVMVNGEPIELTYKEYELLRFLATHRGRVFTREALLDHVWGYDYYGGTRTVDVHIRRLRSKMSPHADYLIETVRNVGYRFVS